MSRGDISRSLASSCTRIFAMREASLSGARGAHGTAKRAAPRPSPGRFGEARVVADVRAAAGETALLVGHDRALGIDRVTAQLGLRAHAPAADALAPGLGYWFGSPVGCEASACGSSSSAAEPATGCGDSTAAVSP